MRYKDRSQNLELSPKDGKKRPRGRPTLASNHLLGARNDWLRLLEYNWPEIGWQLICIRRQRKATIETIREAMMLLVDKPNGGLASAFCRGSSESASPKEIRTDWTKRSRLDQEIRSAHTERNTCERLSLEVESALKQTEEAEEDAAPKLKERIQQEVERRNESLVRATVRLGKLQEQYDTVNRTVLDRESFFCRSELLDFLHSEGRYAVKPRPLAKALAGLPYMRWRQSFVRCAKMPYRVEPQEWYRTFAVIRKIWGPRRQADFSDAPIDLFRNSILRLPKKSYERSFLATNWRDLKLAIEECWQQQHDSESIPFIVTASFVRDHSRQKGNVERVLAAQDSLNP